jgi:hypothetical protein
MACEAYYQALQRISGRHTANAVLGGNASRVGLGASRAWSSRDFGVTAARPQVQRARSRTAVRQAAHAGDVTSMSE